MIHDGALYDLCALNLDTLCSRSVPSGLASERGNLVDSVKAVPMIAGAFRSITPARMGPTTLGIAAEGVAAVDECVADTGVATAVDEGEDGAFDGWKEGDSRTVLWNAGGCEEFGALDILGGLNDGESTIMLGI